MFKREQILFIILGGFFITNALIAEFIGVKIFALEPTLGLKSLDWNIFGRTGSLQFTAGVLLWPVVFIMTDIINEYYGRRGIRLLSYLAVGLISYAFLMVYGAIRLVPAEWWVSNYQGQGVADMQAAFAAVFGQGMWIIAGSLTAFLIGQIVDVTVFHQIRKVTGEGRIWLRATGSTLVSQFIDSFVVLFVAFVLPGQWELDQFLAIGTVNYIYKFTVAILLTPVLYLVHMGLDAYLGKETAQALMKAAASESPQS
ncbi:MAG: queuosine precursor transporter [Bacteroidia bacterium]|jgi:hypothetical protein|nr:queuosine precursor transporter [Bacteroidia bacterium]